MQGCAEPSCICMKRSERGMKKQICGGKKHFFHHHNNAGNARGFLLMSSSTDPSVLLLAAAPGRPAGPTAKREATAVSLQSGDCWGTGDVGWEQRIGQQGGCLLHAAFHRLSHGAASVIHGQLWLCQAGDREASPGALKPASGGERGHSCAFCSASPPCFPVLTHIMLFPAEGFAVPPLTVKAARVGEQRRDFHYSNNILHITPLLLQEPFIPREASSFLRWAVVPTQGIHQLRPVLQG